MTNDDPQPKLTAYGADVIEADTATGRYKWGGADNAISIFEFERGKMLEYPALTFDGVTLQPDESDPDAYYLYIYLARRKADGTIELLSSAMGVRKSGALIMAEMAIEAKLNATHIVIQGARTTGGTITFDMSNIKFEKY